MNIALIGYGKMGQLIHKVAESRGHKVVSIVDPSKGNQIDADTMKGIDVAIDFSVPEMAISNLEKASQYGVNYVMGTTGWIDQMSKVQDITKKSGIGFIWGSNFSLSVQIFFRIIREAAKIANKFEEIDIAAYEAHHRHKLDAPSGTAETMGQIILEELDRKKRLLLDRPFSKISPDDLHLSTIRVGEVPGTHCMIMDTESDTIEIKNTSRNRNGFVLGAVIASEFINGKKGFYDFQDVVI
ncbi:MAG: 4-hydroxy-tetrahydrodipicolinate reductase [Candidatus Gracilibacteria bacterium]|jgi:4-hydroxy-tetrahydrodipicolinate reductase|nr:4-hydroxy-tetrahydrodipicolinate reductase [Candidatus Gracilibacteria bacterium]